MDGVNAYVLVIGFSLLVILSAFFDIISKKTKIPTVLLLIGTGYGLKEMALYYGWLKSIQFFSSLEVLGIIGVILIVLEAALDLELSKDKLWLIVKSFTISLILLVATSALVAYILSESLLISFKVALVYAIPLSVMSSSIIIPSVGGLGEDKKEFMIYEATFSDILGIIFFYAMLDVVHNPNTGQVAVYTFSNIVITIVVAVVISYVLVFVFQKLLKHINYFLVFAILMLLYATGKLFHLSSLIIILFFGLIVNNRKLFFRGFFEKVIDKEKYDNVLLNFKDFTGQTAFLVRTFFFFLFGMSLTFSSLTDFRVYAITLLVMLALYLTRFINLSLFFRKRIFTELFIAPRGLITILLVFSIPSDLVVKHFESDIISMVIIATNLIMMVALILDKSKLEDVHRLGDFYEDTLY